jgi:hypothetical protein
VTGRKTGPGSPEASDGEVGAVSAVGAADGGAGDGAGVADAAAGAADGGAGASGGAPAAPEDDPAVLSVVSGNPTEEELAALTAVVVALGGAADTGDAPNHGRSWIRRALLRLGPTPGPGSWRRSGR